MLVIIVLSIVAIILIYKIFPKNDASSTSAIPEHFEINYDTNQVNNVHHIDSLIEPDDMERELNDHFNNNFFNFANRINHCSNLNDSVDNVNITNKGNDYEIGTKISAIYDDLVNSRDYKTDNTVRCNKNIDATK